MKKLLFTLLLLVAFPVMASHIVGGEFELLHVSGNTYRLNMILYYDAINAAASGTKDPTALVAIFNKRTNEKMMQISLPLIDETDVLYSQPACASTSLKTTRLLYSSTITLSPEIYSEPQGYYISWQRCCRNYQVINVVNNVSSGGIYAGQTFYLEFPPVIKNGESFVNSSPKLFPPLSDYACPFISYYKDFGGIDDDNDSLVYSLVTPLNTKSRVPVPKLDPLPYPDVIWQSPFSLSNVMNGSPDLSISQDGLLTVTPGGIQGLFVFAVKVEEFRDKVKIGESRRDFQMLVTETSQCKDKIQPKILGKKKEVTSDFQDKLLLNFSTADPESARCILVKVSDNSSIESLEKKENVGIRLIGLNFKNSNLNKILPNVTTAVLTNGSESEFQICFPQCPFIKGSYSVGIIAYDDTCPLPRTDTLIVTVNVTSPNKKANFTEPISTAVTESIREGEVKSWEIIGEDVDLDELKFVSLTDGFRFENFGFSLEALDGYPNNLGSGQFGKKLVWKPDCNKYDFFKKENFNIKFLLDDIDKPCLLNDPDTVVFKLNFQEFPKNADPVISINGLGVLQNQRKIDLEKKVLDIVSFQVLGTDADNDPLALGGSGVGFSLSDNNIIFPGATNNGTVASDFTWNIACEKIDLKKKDTYSFRFLLVDDKNKCRYYKADTVDVNVKLSTPDNEAPQLVALNSLNTNISNSTVEYTLGQPIEFTVQGTDNDLLGGKDNLSLTLVNANGKVPPTGFTFLNKKEKSPVSSVFLWSPDCSIFKDGIFENEYEFKFGLADDRCLNPKSDQMSIKVKIKDIEGASGKFEMPNAFTPNGDKVNEYFLLEGTGSLGEPVNVLPKDNCVDQFVSVKIINRWGDVVFESKDRNFMWDAKGIAPGVYFYRLIYTNKEFKSSLTVYY